MFDGVSVAYSVHSFRHTTHKFHIYYYYYYYYYYYCCYYYVFRHRPFIPGTSLKPAVIFTAQLQASHCSTFRIMCDVPSIAVFCSESIECFPGIASKFFLKLLVTVPVAPIITGIIVYLLLLLLLFRSNFRFYNL